VELIANIPRCPDRSGTNAILYAEELRSSEEQAAKAAVKKSTIYQYRLVTNRPPLCLEYYIILRLVSEPSNSS
jgi:hypothetical protein